MAMATSMCATTATVASLLQRSLACESQSSSSVKWSPRRTQVLGRRFSKNRGGKERSERNLAVRAAIVHRDVDSEPLESPSHNISTNELLCCPVCFKPLSRTGPGGLNLAAIKESGFACKSCERGFSNTGDYLDLTILEASKVYEEDASRLEDWFRNPIMSYVYERGWRQSFSTAGFPGADEEFKMAQNYFQSVKGGGVLDVSCGSGLFARRFAQSGDYESVIALDFSEDMLRQSNEFIKQDASLRSSNVALVRADVARLPFASGSIDAVYSGAALQCWPCPAAGMADISRILKPGGVFVASTFLIHAPVMGIGNKDLRRAIKRTITNAIAVRYFEESELEELCGVCGFVEYSPVTQKQFIMLSAKRARA